MKQDAFFEIDHLVYPVYIGYDIWDQIQKYLQPFYHDGGIYILTDHNTKNLCLPVLLEHIPDLKDQSTFSIPPGERSKDLSCLSGIWNWLMKSGATRESLLINLGGGVVSDLGGFAAAAYKRGIRYINIPTSLIGQVDASVGGKTGINLERVKNQAGLFYDPSAVFIQPAFLQTLPENHFKSGVAEMIKTALLSGNKFWEKIKNAAVMNHVQLVDLIHETIRYKCNIVKKDPFDQAVRKALNFGHTVGHALEALYNSPGSAGMLHGEAVAAGMICEAYIANKAADLSRTELDEISHVLLQYFDFKPIEERYFGDLLNIMLNDKKRSSDNISFSLLEGIGKPCFNIEVSQDEIISSFYFYNQLMQDDQDNKK